MGCRARQAASKGCAAGSAGRREEGRARRLDAGAPRAIPQAQEISGAGRSETRLAFRCPARETGKIALFLFPAASGWHAPLAPLTAPGTAGLQAISIDSG